MLLVIISLLLNLVWAVIVVFFIWQYVRFWVWIVAWARTKLYLWSRGGVKREEED